MPRIAHRKTERAIKCGVLFLVLVFAAYFLFEQLAGFKIHPLECAWWVRACGWVLLSLAALIRFGWAYLAAASMTILLFGRHSLKLLPSSGRMFIIAGRLAGMYRHLHLALQIQDYARLLGTGALFLMLAVVIWATRNVDW